MLTTVFNRVEISKLIRMHFFCW